MSYELGGENAVPFSAHGTDYVIRKSGSVYLAEGRLGNQDLHNDSLVALWDAIYGEVAEPTIQFTRGAFTVDGVLRILGNNTTIVGMGPRSTFFEAGVNLNDHMFEWDSGDYYYNVLLKDFYIDGNSDNQGGAGPYRGINMDITAACTNPLGDGAYNLYLSNVTIKDCKGTGFYLRTVSGAAAGCWMAYCRIATNGGGGETVDASFERMFDARIAHNYISSMKLLKGITTCHFTGNYYGGGGEQKVVEYSGCTAANPAQGNLHIGDFFDNVANGGNADSGCLSLEDHSWNIEFAGCTFGRNAGTSTANTGAQVQIIDDATRHRFLGCSWYHPSVLTRTFNYAIWEKDNADYNVYSGSISRLDRPDSGLTVYGTGYWNVNGNSDVDGLRVI